MKQSAILILYGRVQGVGFRYYVKRHADFLGISGFVRNRPDGSVYIEAEAEPMQLQQFIALCRQGPAHARVDQADIQYCPEQGFTGFEKS